jgi:hypothetical protein
VSERSVWTDISEQATAGLDRFLAKRMSKRDREKDAVEADRNAAAKARSKQ